MGRAGVSVYRLSQAMEVGLANQCGHPKKSLYGLKRTEEELLNARRGSMNEYKSWKILQIIPAQGGWKAVHCQELEDRQIEISNRPIICWALVEPVGETTVVRTQVRGIEQELNDLAVVEDLIDTEDIRQDGTDRNQYFLGYNDPEAHKESDYWIKQANHRLRTEKEKRLEKRN
jgi:hypothetical protein